MNFKIVIFSVVAALTGSNALAALTKEAREFPLRLPGGELLHAKALIVADAGTRARKLPALLVFGGFEEAGRVLELLDPKIPVVLASVDYPYRGPRRFEFPGTLREAPRLRRAARDMTAAVEALASEIARVPEVDPSRLGVIGASFGAPFALEAAANLGARMRYVILVHGFADAAGTIEHRLHQIWSDRLGWLARPAAWLTARLIWAYLGAPDPGESAARLAAGTRAVMIEATEDRFIPRPARERLWERLRASRAQVSRIAMPGDHVQPGSDALIAEIMRKVERWLGEN
jgi:dienelactone hydrolase